jgi:large subunit ribosomal protein L13e
LSPAFARSVGISVDHRRTSTSEEQLAVNVARLSTYKSKLILFPRRENKPKKGEINDATAEQLKSAAATHQVVGNVLPITHAAQEVKFEAISAPQHAKKGVFHTLRSIRTNRRYKGRREKKAQAEKDKAK